MHGWTSSNGGANTTIVATSLGTWTQADTITWANAGGTYSVSPTPAAADGNLQANPDLDADANGDWRDDDWVLGPVSAARDAGDATVRDVNGSRADAGATGGPTPLTW